MTRGSPTTTLPDAEALVEKLEQALDAKMSAMFKSGEGLTGKNLVKAIMPIIRQHTEQAAKVSVADQGADNSISDMIISIAKGNPTMDNLTLRIVAVLHRHTKPERCVDTVRFGDAKEIAEAIVEEVKLTSSGRESNEAAGVDAPTPIGKYSGQHPRHEHLRIIGYLYDDKWPQLYQLPDDPLRTSQPSQPVSLKTCLFNINEAFGRISDYMTNEDVIQTVLDAAGVPYVE